MFADTAVVKDMQQELDNVIQLGVFNITRLLHNTESSVSSRTGMFIYVMYEQVQYVRMLSLKYPFCATSVTRPQQYIYIYSRETRTGTHYTTSNLIAHSQHKGVPELLYY